MGSHTVRHDCSNLAHTQTPAKQQSAQLLGCPPVKRGARRDAGTPGGEVSLSVHGGSWADVTSPSPRRSPHRPEGTFWASAAALTYGRGAGSSVSSQHLQLGLRPCSAPSRGTTTRRTTAAGTASPHPGCDNLRGCRVWPCLPLLLPSHARITAASPQPQPQKQPPPPYFLWLLVSSTALASLEAAPWRQTNRHTQEWASSPCADVRPSACFVSSPFHQPTPLLPSFQVHLRIYLQEAFGGEAGPASATRGCLSDFLQCHRFSVSACDGQTPPPSPHPLGLSLSKSPLSLPSSLPSTLLSRATELQTANLKGSKGFLKLLPHALMLFGHSATPDFL